MCICETGGVSSLNRRMENDVFLCLSQKLEKKMQGLIFKILISLTALIMTLNFLNELSPKAGMFLIGTLAGLTITYMMPNEIYQKLEEKIKKIRDKIRHSH